MHAEIATPAQLHALADVATEFSRGFGHITTRQNLQFHFVRLHDAEPAMRRLAEAGLTTREACGNSVRNVTACPLAGVCKTETFDVIPYARATAKFMLGHPDAQNFGRKFKIAFSGCREEACGLVNMHDMGAIAATRMENGKTRRGFELYVGGGLGAVTIQFREFGIRLTFTPTLTPRGTIRLQVAPEVSSLDYANALTCITAGRLLLTVLAFSGFVPNLWDQHLIDTEDPQPYINKFKAGLEFAADLGIKGLRVDCVQPPTIIREVEYGTAMDRVVRTWRKCADIAADAGQYVTWEFEPGFVFNKPSDIVRIHDAVDKENFGLIICRPLRIRARALPRFGIRLKSGWQDST